MDITIVLMEPNNSGNVGAIARAMANFGFEKLTIINPRCDKDDDEARNRAKHAQKVLDKAKVLKKFDDVLKKFDLIIGTSGVQCVDYNIPRSPVLPSELLKTINDSNQSGNKKISGKIALVFGREDDGLSNSEIEKCDFLVTIPTDKKYPIMNLSHAVSVLLYELSKEKLEKDLRETHKLVSAKDKEILRGLIYEVLNTMKFSTENEKETQRKVWVRLIGKGVLTRREAFSLMGFLKKAKK